MKRSEINAHMETALAICSEHGFRLPPFATWGPEEWQSKGIEASGIVRQQIGWDITDFGSGAFDEVGLILFTIRNGVFREVEQDPLLARAYAEKILITAEEQVTPTHFHYFKTEDIINRGGGVLEIQLWNSDEAEGLADSEVTVNCDGVSVTVPAGGRIELRPGESVTLPRLLYHKFWGKKGKGTVLVGEVSRVCDEYTDNRFLEPVGRFAEIEEDEAPRFLLFDDYKRYYSHYDEVTSTE
jgi:D-lyxose ketol-isomerase